MKLKNPNKGAVCIYKSWWSSDEVLSANRGKLIKEVNQDLICLVADRPKVALVCALTGRLWLDIAWNVASNMTGGFKFVLLTLEIGTPEYTIMDIYNTDIFALAKIYENAIAEEESDTGKSMNVELYITTSIIRTAVRLNHNPDSIGFQVFVDTINALISVIMYTTPDLYMENYKEMYNILKDEWDKMKAE